MNHLFFSLSQVLKFIYIYIMCVCVSVGAEHMKWNGAAVSLTE